MDKRRGFDNLNEQILDFVTNGGGCVRRAHIERVFPFKDKEGNIISNHNPSRNINYLLKNRRLYQEEGDLLSDKGGTKPQPAMYAAVCVLCGAFDNVESYSFAAYPAQINFVTKKTEMYEIIYVRYGDEAGIQASISVHEQRRPKNNFPISKAKRMVIVEDLSQIEKLQIPGTARYAMMQPNGEMDYFKPA